MSDWKQVSEFGHWVWRMPFSADTGNYLVHSLTCLNSWSNVGNIKWEYVGDFNYSIIYIRNETSIGKSLNYSLNRIIQKTLNHSETPCTSEVVWFCCGFVWNYYIAANNVSNMLVCILILLHKSNITLATALFWNFFNNVP